ncbi:hypothetical protein [Bradyrhizobium sp.]|uniref:hypothetical protein n=1 Tax=Bradyrhizobium sp. TaxID=376 RepID=UPI002D7E2DCF|nr:hypothetical protein [Bradyrhizobium sp.]
MTLRLNRAAGSPQWYGNWPRPGRPPFMASDAYRVLLTEMRRYVHEEVAGRAFLISGYRGAGKTTLVQRVVDDLGDELFRDLTKTSAPSPTQQSLARRPQRPLLVKLHGPSLLADELPRPGGGEKPKESPPSATSSAGTNSENAKSENAKSEDTKSDLQPAPTTNTGTAHGALIQITIALYRALAREFAEAYAVHARAAHRLEADDQLDIAAQFQLDLDRAPETALLRAYWQRLADDAGANAMSAGIVWPGEIGVSVAAAGLPDQGAREIVALATAAQAFQVCSGAVTYRQSRKDSASYERIAESKAGIDAKDAINRIVGLTIGGLLGLGAAGAAGLSPAAGAGIGLLGSLAVTASVKRSARQERNEDYTFIVDRSIETLERDLPLVIERVREAGLAPVFLVDELDKLETSDQTEKSAAPSQPDAQAPAAPQPTDKPNGTRKTVTELIRRLKHLTTDFGFFCFLTGPDYFEEVQRKIETLAFPEEHTYFSDRLFVLYAPDELDAFLRSVMTSTALPNSPDFITDETARGVLARVIIHSSRLNTIDVVRALAHGWTEDGLYKVQSGTLTSQPRYRLAVGVQLAIEVVQRSTKLAARTARDPRLRQTAVDTLYMISREWERGETEIDLSAAALAKHLLKRRGKDTSDLADEAAITELEKTVMEANVAELTGALGRLSELLCDFRALHDAMEKEGRAPDELALAQLAAGTTPIALLRKPSAGSQMHVFRYDYDGNELPPPPVAAERAPGALPEVAAAESGSEIAPLVAFGREVVGAMNQLGLTFSDLSGIGLLPPGLSQGEVTRVIARLDIVAGSQPMESRMSADLVVLRDLSEAFAARGPVLGWAIDLALDVAHDAGQPQRGTLPATLRAMARFLDFASLAPLAIGNRTAFDRVVEGGPSTPAPPPPQPDGTTEGMQAWRTWLALRPDRPVRLDLDVLVDEAWRRWESRIVPFIEGATIPATRAAYDDLVLAAADRMPSRVMRAHPRQIGPLDWSELALAGSLGRPAGIAQPWALLAGLRKQGFGRDLLSRIWYGSPSTGDVANPPRRDLDWIVRLVGNAPAAEKGILVIVSEEAEPLERDDPGPYLFLREARIEEYDEAVKWLTDLGAFRMGIDER